MLGSSPWSTAWGALQATSCPEVNEAAPGKSIYQGKEPNPGSPLLLFRQDLDRSWGFRRGSHQATSFESALHSWVCCKGQVGDPFFRDRSFLLSQLLSKRELLRESSVFNTPRGDITNTCAVWTGFVLIAQPSEAFSHMFIFALMR